MNQLFARKSLKVLLADMESDNRLRRVLGPVSLTALGVGAVIGAGIFVATGAAANAVAGPALMVSYMMAGVTCIFAALCYAEFASMAPVAGSAYTYAYTTMGELFAWIIGWDLVLEYAVGAATVANGWSGYFASVIKKFGLVIPLVVSGAPIKYDEGHFIPNAHAVYKGADYQDEKGNQAYKDAAAMQKVMDSKEARWVDKSVKPAHGVFWVLEKQESEYVVIGEVGNAEVEAHLPSGVYKGAGYKDADGKPAYQDHPAVKKVMDNKQAEWVDKGVRPAQGTFWVLEKPKKYVVVGEVGNAAVEAQLTDFQQSLVNLPAIIIVAIITLVLIKGIQESATFNAAMVFLKVAAVVFVILVGAFFIHPENWEPFAPYGWTGVSFFGIPVMGKTNAGGEPVGMLAGAAIIFFAYIGFDSVSTHAEEAKNPQRDVPIGIIASLLICTVLYVLVVAVLTGMVPYTEISKDAGVSEAFKHANLPWAEFIIAAAGVAGITSVLLVMMLSAPRVFLAMARDGLVPKKLFASVHPRFQTPWISTILIGVFVAILAGLLPIDALLHLTNIGTLFAFVIVCGAVLMMRRIDPDAKRPFRCPLVPVVPILGIGCCLVLMLSLPAANWLRLIGWLALGLAIYFFYGRHHSILGKELRGEIAHHGLTPPSTLDEGNKPH